MANNPRLNLGELEATRSKTKDRGRPLLALLVILILAGVVGWFWLARTPDKRDELLRRVDEVTGALPGVSSITGGSGTAGASGLVNNMKSAVASMVDSVMSRGTTPPEIGVTAGSALPGAPAPLSTAPTETDSTGMTAEASVEGAAAVNTAEPFGVGLTSSSGNATRPAEHAGLAGAGTVITAPEGTDPFTGGVTLQGGASERGDITAQTPPADAGRPDDMVVRVAFIEDLAKWLVGNYAPSGSAKGRGFLQVSLQAANMRYGVGMRGLYWIGDDLPKGRSEALRYVFTPSMLDALYRLYIDRFMESMALASDAPQGQNKPLTPTQRSDMYRQYAKRFRGLSGTLQGVAAMPDLLARGESMRADSQQVVEANTHYSELIYAQDQAREGGNTAGAASMQSRVDEAATAYQKALMKRERTREAFARAITNNAEARTLDDETRIYVGQWVGRRLREDKDKVDAALQAATLFLDLAQRFEQAAGADS